MARAPRPPAEMCEDWLATEFIERRRGLIVCGPQDDPAFPAAVAGLAATLGYPLLADALSGVRCGPHRDGIVLGAYDNFLRSAALGESLLPDLVLRFGAAPVSKQLATYLQRQEQALHVLVSPDGAWRDPELTATAVVEADATAFCRAFQWQTESYEPARDWLGTWQKAEVDAMSALEDCFRGETAASEPSAFWDLARVLPQGGAVYAGNSMPVRDLDGFFAAGGRDALFLANRGASGIDGVVSSALGAAAAHEGRLVLVVGDLSFYHDMNGLLAAKRFGLRATIVLLNNDGGGIFSFLPQHDEAEHFEALFGTPHGLDFSHVAPLYGVGFRRVASREEYRAALQASFESDGVEVIEVRTDRVENLRLHQRVWAAVAQAVSPLPQGKG
jgi:2-succinyl-5-enolpyruvyl-6-hydroxy-3-cyclohexene-1-carboxylate synthase